MKLHSPHFRPFRQYPSFAIQRQIPPIPPISALFESGSPCTVLFIVSSVIVHPVQCQQRRWAWSHIRYKMSELQPAGIFNSDSSSTIVFIASISRIPTTSYHLSPDVPFWCMPQSMSSVPFDQYIPHETATTPFSRCYHHRTYFYYFPARASAYPQNITKFIPVVGHMQNSQSPKDLSCDILDFSHAVSILSREVWSGLLGVISTLEPKHSNKYAYAEQGHSRYTVGRDI